MFNFIKSIFHLPTAKELGRSDSEALPMRWLNHGGKYTWEDWQEEVSENYPVKYFIYKTLPRFIRRQFNKISDLKYYIVSFTIRKYHLLNLQQPKNSHDNYRYGWIDSDYQMVYAVFTILVNL